MPKGFEHPRDGEGNAMLLFAQINFEEIRILNQCAERNSSVFSLPTDDVYGLDFGDPTNQENFRVVYHAEVNRDETQLVTDFSYVPEVDDEMPPICSEGKNEI